jgi:hypothetical protein
LILLALVDLFFFLRKEPAGAVITRRWARTLLGLGAALILGILCSSAAYAFRYSALPGNPRAELSGYQMLSVSDFFLSQIHCCIVAFRAV